MRGWFAKVMFEISRFAWLRGERGMRFWRKWGM